MTPYEASPLAILAANAYSKHVWVSCDLIQDWNIISNRNDPVTAIHEFRPQFPIASCLREFIMHCSIAEDADVGGVEKIWDATRIRNGPLDIIRQAVEASSECS